MLENRSILSIIAVAFVFVGCMVTASEKGATTHIPATVPTDSDSAGRSGPIAAQSVVRIVCPKEDSAGSGFLHKSGKILTADHVVRGCSEIFVVPASSEPIKATVIAANDVLDLSLLALASPLLAPSLPISKRSDLSIGAHVSTWGFPAGYLGELPLLSVGYLAGAEAIKFSNGQIVRQWVVNAAFNKGNSGGPLLLIETGEVIGLVSSKLAPISQTAKNALNALEKQQSGVGYEATRPDGSKVTFSEGQVIALVLRDLRNQVQLVIGRAVVLRNILEFLKANGVEP